MGLTQRRASDIVLIKAILLHVFQKKSWRTVALEVGISYVVAFQFYTEIKIKMNFMIYFNILSNVELYFLSFMRKILLENILKVMRF